MLTAGKLALLACGIFFLTGLLTGVWKYLRIWKSPTAEAPRYVSVAHQASLLYAFAALVLFQFLQFSPYSETVNIAAVALPVLFFALAIASYVAHAIAGDTDNQFRKPYGFGRVRIPPALFHVFVWLLIAAELGGFLVLFAGFLQTHILK